MLGVVGDDAAKVLEKIDNPELATSLKGQERAEYLQALDEVYGPQAQRAKDMGFGKKDWFHGTEADIKSFDNEKLGSKMTGFTTKEGHHFASKPEHATTYTFGAGPGGNIIPVKIKKPESAYYPDSSTLMPSDAYTIKEHFKQKNSPIVLKDIIDTNYSAYSDPEYLKTFGHKESDYGDIAVVKNPSQIRSKFAAFDPRFKDSALLMAGAGAIPQADINPMDALKGIKENIAEPVVEKYNKLKSYVTGPLARQMNLSKDPEIEKGLKQGLDMGLDPVNLIPGGAGVGAGLLQLLGEKDEEE